VAPNRADAISSMMIEFGDSRCERVADRSLVAESEMRPLSIYPRIKRSGGVRLAPVDGRLAFFRTIESDCAQ
jgi:hypothetical protein